jgi:hypothetical protein
MIMWLSMKYGILQDKKDTIPLPKCTISNTNLCELTLFFRNAIAACVVFDVTNRESFEKCQIWVQELHEKAIPEI